MPATLDLPRGLHAEPEPLERAWRQGLPQEPDEISEFALDDGSQPHPLLMQRVSLIACPPTPNTRTIHVASPCVSQGGGSMPG